MGNTPRRGGKPVIVTGNCLNYIDNAEKVSINPLIPQSWGIFKAVGDPQTPGRKYPAPLFQRYHRVELSVR